MPGSICARWQIFQADSSDRNLRQRAPTYHPTLQTPSPKHRTLQRPYELVIRRIIKHLEDVGGGSAKRIAGGVSVMLSVVLGSG